MSKIDLKEQYQVFEKAKLVIDSCVNVKQIRSCEKYISLFYRKFKVSNINKTLDEQYFSLHSKIKECKWKLIENDILNEMNNDN